MRMTTVARLLTVLLILACAITSGVTNTAAAARHRADSASGNAPAAEGVSEASVRCRPFGLYGTITADVLVAGLSDSSEDLIFVGTSNGLYVVGLDGTLRHFLYTPFGVRFVALINDVSGDGIREVVVVLNDTQVPALRCYDGSSWEKLWQFAPTVKVWDQLWVERQVSIGDLEVIRDLDSQSVVFTSDRCVYCVRAEDGAERWRSGASHTPKTVTAVADINGDSADEVFVAAEDGYLILINGHTGDTRWQTRLPETTMHGAVGQPTAEHLLTLEGEDGKVTAASNDGMVRLFDLANLSVEWEVQMPTEVGNSPRPVALVPNATPDGRAGILVSYSGSEATDRGREQINQVALLNADGSSLWDRSIDASSLDTGSYGGRPVIIAPTVEEIRLVDMADGETVAKTIPVSTPDEWGMDVRQIGEDAFLLVGSLTAISSSGEVLWHYPRIGNVRTLSGQFVGDETEDTLFLAEWKSTPQYAYTPPRGITITGTGTANASEGAAPEVRLLKVMNGATGEIVWTYEVPLSDLKRNGGLKGIRVTADVVANDGLQDIICYSGDTVFIFSGKDGTPSGLPVGRTIEALDATRAGASARAIAVSTANGLAILDSAATELWATTSTEWTDRETVRFMVLDDVNSDNVSDLAVLSADRIVLLKSTAGSADYEPDLTFTPETGSKIEYVESLPDADGDGVRELAYIQRNPGNQQPDKYTSPGCPVLTKLSPVDGERMVRTVLPGSRPAIDLDCGDFNGDGWADSLVCYNSYDSCSSAVSGLAGSGQLFDGIGLWIISGRDGSTICTHIIDHQTYGWSGWNTSPPATPIGDVTDDGICDLAWTVAGTSQEYSGGYCNQQCIEVYDAARDQPQGSIPVTPCLREGSTKSSVLLPVDVNADGRSEILAAVYEPFASSDYTQHLDLNQNLAVMDMRSGQRLAAFMGFSLESISLFETNQPGVLGVAALGGAYYLDTNARLELTSPADGAGTGPVVQVTWEGGITGEFAQVFVDGVRNHSGNDSGVDLYLAHGDHDIVVRSVDDCGRILYGPSDMSAPVSVKVTPSFWKPVLLVLSLFISVAALVLFFYARLHRMWRARKRAAKA